MGGLSGHMLHPYEDFDLRISDIKDMVLKSLTGQMNFIEKVDGYNIQIMINKIGDIRYLRCNKDLKEGGIRYDQLDERFQHNPNFLKIIKYSTPHIKSWVLKNYLYLKLHGFIGTGLPIAIELLYGNENSNFMTNTIPYLYTGSPVKVIFHGFEELEKRDDLKIDSIADNADNINIYMKMLRKWVFTKEQIQNNVTLRTYYQQRYFQYINSPQFGYQLNRDTLAGLIQDGFDYLFEQGKNTGLKTFNQLSKKHISTLPENSTFNIRFLSLVDGKSPESKTFIKELKKFVYKGIKLFFMSLGDRIIQQIQSTKNGDTNQHKLVNGLVIGNPGLQEQFLDLYKQNTDFDILNSQYEDYKNLIEFRILEGVVFQYDGTGNTYKYTGYFPVLNKTNKKWVR